MAVLQDVEWEVCLLEPHHDTELERSARREMGIFVPPIFPYFEPCPWAARALLALTQHRVLLVHMDFALTDLVGLVVSQDNSCRFCYAAQRALLRAQGLSQARIRQLEDDMLAAQSDPRDRAALEFAKRVSRCSPRPSQADRARLREAGWDGEGIAELAFVAAANVFMNRVATIPALPCERAERIAEHWLLGLLAPLTKRVIRSRRRRAPRVPLPAEMRAGPYAELVLRLDGLPAARALRRVLDEAWGSPLLPARSKGLVFAVVARGLGCPRSEAEAKRLLAVEGLAADEVERVLTHLGSPALDPLEAAVVPFARETIRYLPVQVQRRARELFERLDHRQFIELVGIASLANAVCRLWIALDAA